MRKQERHLEITTIAGCKVSCAYCPQALFALEHKKVSNDRLMSLDTFKMALHTVPEEVDIHFSGYSEAFLNENCILMIKHAFDKGHSVSVYTTVEGMTINDVHELEKLSFKKFVIHLPDDGLHMRVKVDHHYLNVFRELINSSIPNLTFIDYFGIHPEVMSLIKNNDTVSRKLTSRAGNVSNDLTGKPPNIKGPLRCRVGRDKKNVLLPNGDVSLCCVDYGRQHVLGNLVQNSYGQLHQSEPYNSILERMKSGKGELLCRTCEWAEPITWKKKLKEFVKRG